jgi:pimeloyl-ACP methyl ester carboxylesterase
MPKTSRKPEDFIVPLNMNGLEGRMLRLPSRRKREILFIYGQHSSLERWWGLSLELSKLGTVTMPDLPGLGGMTPLYKIGQKPDLDAMADYLAAFVKLKYRNKRVTIIGMSLGFVIVTRMLQRYPELVKKVDYLVSIVGFGHKSDFVFSKKRIFIYKILTRIFAHKIPAWIFRHVLLQPALLNLVYHHTFNAREKFANVSGDEFRRTMDMEIQLWHMNDVRTQFQHNIEMFKVDNTKQRIDLPLHHVASRKDRYFENARVEEHLRKIFSDFTIYYMKSHNHAPTVIANAKDAAPFIPPELRRKIQSSK